MRKNKEQINDLKNEIQQLECDKATLEQQVKELIALVKDGSISSQFNHLNRQKDKLLFTQCFSAFIPTS